MKGIRQRINTTMLLIAVAMLQAVTALAGERTVSQDNLTELQAQLEQAGWRVEHSSSGELLLWPPSQETTPPGKKPIKTENEKISATDIDLLTQKLREKGWQVNRSKDGDLLLYPSNPSAKVEKQAVPADETGGLDDLRGLLAASGWRVEKKAEGDLLLYPELQKEIAEAQPQEFPLTDIKGVKTALEKAGWKTEKRSDGSLILHTREGVDSTVEMVPGPVASGAVALPVDSWKEARLIAKHWISGQDNDALTLGKIREVNWIYLVSIVSKSPPYRLNNQLAIRKRDGSVLPIF